MDCDNFILYIQILDVVPKLPEPEYYIKYMTPKPGQDTSLDILDLCYKWPTALDTSQERQSQIIQKIPLPTLLEELSSYTRQVFIFN